MKTVFKVLFAALLASLVGAIYGFISHYFDIFPFFALVTAGLTYTAVTIISKQENKKIAALAILLGLLTFYCYISTGYGMLKSDVRDEIIAITQQEYIVLSEEELETAIEYYTGEYLMDVTGHAGKRGFISLEARRGFFSTRRMKNFDGEGVYILGLIFFAAKAIIMILGPGFAVIHKDEAEEHAEASDSENGDSQPPTEDQPIN